ncbi:hypothetical protein AAY473_001040 [Plecturocebus cupreus]
MLTRMVSISRPCELPSSASQSAEITDMSNCTRPEFFKLGLPLLPRLEKNSITIANCDVKLLGSSDPPTSASRIAGTTTANLYTWLIFLIFTFVEVESHYVAQAGLKLLDSSDPPTAASQSTGITCGTYREARGEDLHSHHSAPSCSKSFQLLFGFETVSLCRADWSAVVLSWLTATSASLIKTILPPQPPERLGLQLACQNVRYHRDQASSFPEPLSDP